MHTTRANVEMRRRDQKLFTLSTGYFTTGSGSYACAVDLFVGRELALRKITNIRPYTESVYITYTETY